MPDIMQYIPIPRFEVFFVCCAILLEIFVRSRLAKSFVRRAVLLDLVYCAFYRFGIYAFLIGGPIEGLIGDRFTLGIIADTPVWFRAALFIPLQDFGYWITHKWCHDYSFLWAFHQVHHSQEDLGILATYRLHPVDMWLRNFLGPTLFLILLGLPLAAWLPLTLAYDVLINVSHLEVKWTYGPFGKLLVSPVFHSIHHSVEEQHHNANYGAVLSIWDRIFGTVFESSERAAAVGLPGWRVKENFLSHMWAPIPALFQHYRGKEVTELAPIGEPPESKDGEGEAGSD